MEKYTKLSKKSILILVLLLIVVCLALIVFDFFGRVKHYSFGEEIRAFPIEQTAVIFTEWKITKTFHGDDAGEGNVFVVINYTVRNIGDTELSLSEFRSAQTPILKYGNYYAEARHIPVWIPLPSPGGENCGIYTTRILYRLCLIKAQGGSYIIKSLRDMNQKNSYIQIKTHQQL